MVDTSVFRNIRIVLWYLKRPQLYPQFFRRLVSKFSGSSNTSKESKLWCEKYAIGSFEAIEKTTGIANQEDIREKFSTIFDQAESVAQACPVQMGGAGDVNLLYWICEYLEAKSVIETGVAYGWSSLSLLLSISTRPNSRLISTDMPYVIRDNDDYVGCVVSEDLRHCWKIIKRADHEALPKALKEFESIDLCYYDSDKNYKGRMWAYPLLWKKLRSGGCFISDDIGDDVAFRDFCKQLDMSPIIVRFPEPTDIKYIGILFKQ